MNEGKEIVCGCRNVTGATQSPFVTLFLNIPDSEEDDEYEYRQEVADIVEEILKQRIQGIKNEKGVYSTPPFPFS